jgi:hypothetical protein
MTKKEKEGGDEGKTSTPRKSKAVREGMRKRERPSVSFWKL